MDMKLISITCMPGPRGTMFSGQPVYLAQRDHVFRSACLSRPERPWFPVNLYTWPRETMFSGQPVYLAQRDRVFRSTCILGPERPCFSVNLYTWLMFSGQPVYLAQAIIPGNLSGVANILEKEKTKVDLAFSKGGGAPGFNFIISPLTKIYDFFLKKG